MLFKIKGFSIFYLVKVIASTAYSYIMYGKKFRYVRSAPYILYKGKLSLGVDVSLGETARIELVNSGSELHIGDNTIINDYCHIGVHDKMKIGKNVLIGSRVTIIDHDHGSYSEINNDSPLTPPKLRECNASSISIGDNCWIGDGAVVLKGVSLFPGSVVGANSVVTKSFEQPVILIGNPARVIREYKFNTRSWEKV